MEKRLIVVAPVADLRAGPFDGLAGYGRDDNRLSQVLYNETLILCDDVEGWFQVEAEEQLRSNGPGAWHGYRGWVRKDVVEHVSQRPAFNAVVCSKSAIVRSGPSGEAPPIFTLLLGTKLVVVGEEAGYGCVDFVDGGTGWVRLGEIARTGLRRSEKDLRERVLDTARLFLGSPYLWGGRSVYEPDFSIPTGVDCSGLTNLAYRVAGIDIPRDARDQRPAAAEIGHDELKPADLVFISAKGEHENIIHVMFYLGGEEFIEAVETGRAAMVNSFMGKFNLTLMEIAHAGGIVDEKKISFGSVIAAPEDR